MEKFEVASRMRQLIDNLNNLRQLYYNENISAVSDYEYDKMFDELARLEDEFKIVYPDSPTQNVGYTVKDGLDKITHEYPMLSLDKTKDINKLMSYFGDTPVLVMAKMDGLTLSLTYENGVLVRAETRGDGTVGEDVTHNAKVVRNIPRRIDRTDRIVIHGEIIIRKHDFNAIKELYVDSKGKTYKNPRNFASGSIRLHDSIECSKRELMFVAWRYVEGSMNDSFFDRLCELEQLGFDVCPFYQLENNTYDEYERLINTIQFECSDALYNYPIDGCVIGIDSVSEGEQCGRTEHHFRNQLAFKFYDDLYPTTLRSVDWTMGKTGTLCPTAIFDTVEIDGTEVSRASMHNITIMKQLGARIGCSCDVYKANQIIPQIDNCADDGVNDIYIPLICPICGCPTDIVKEKDTEVLICTNEDCKGKLLGKMINFVSKQGMDIDGLSEGKLEFLIDEGFITTYMDIYTEIPLYHGKLLTYEGWGETSVTNLLSAIEASRNNVTLDKFLTSLSIPNIGKASAKLIAEYCNGSIESFLTYMNTYHDWSHIDGFGEKTAKSITDWWSKHNIEIYPLVDQLNFVCEDKSVINSKVAGKTFCITGSFSKTRTELQKEIEALGCKFVSGVSKNTDILFAGEKAGSKLTKAQALGVTIVIDVDSWLENNR